MQLTAEQQAIADHSGGHAKIIAVAGSGKTTALLHYVRNRLEAGIPPERILVLMYNRSAREDFEKRLARMELPCHPPKVFTFHSLGYRLYRAMMKRGLLAQKNLDPLPEARVQLKLWELIQELAPDSMQGELHGRKQSLVEGAEFFLEYTKSDLAGPAAAFEKLGYPPEYRFFLDVYKAFEDWRHAESAITFSDLVFDPAMLFSLRSDIAREFGGHYEEILVDEYQDINASQHFLLTTIYGGHGNVIGIGDPDQTIYEWRGSDPAFLLQGFDQHFDEATTYKLSVTFRYGHALALAANHFIANNSARADIHCIATPSNPQTEIELVESEAEADWLVKYLKKPKNRDNQENIAILVRLWSCAAPLELALMAAGIPFRSNGKKTVLARRELRPLFWMLKLAAGGFTNLSPAQRGRALLELMSTPHVKVQKARLERICTAVADFEGNWGKQLQKADLDGLSRYQLERLVKRGRLLHSLEMWKKSAGALLRHALKQLDYLDGLADDGFNAQQTDEKKQVVSAFCRYVDKLKLPPDEALSHLQSLQSSHQEMGAGGVRITTMHQSKGLEWDTVIIPSLNHQTLPYSPSQALATPASVESERRLFYVAMTRARERLHLLAPLAAGKDQTTREISAESSVHQSPFIAEAQLLLANAIADAVYNRAEKLDLKFPISRQALTYLAEFDCNPTINAPEPVNAQPGLGDAIQHRNFGHGRVIRAAPNFIEVIFSDRSARTLAWPKAQEFLV